MHIYKTYGKASLMQCKHETSDAFASMKDEQ